MRYGKLTPPLVLGLVLSVAVSAGPLAMAEDGEQQASERIDAAELFDKEFNQYVDLRLFGVAWKTLDAQLMTDVALQLREAEAELDKQHPAITSEQMLKFAAKMASEGKDAETLRRLQRVAEASGDQARAGELKQLVALAANARDLRNDEMFTVEDLEKNAPAAFGNLILQIRAAELAGDKEVLDHLRKAVKELEPLRKPHQERLYGLIDPAMDLLDQAGKDKTSDLLRALGGASRDFTPGTQPPQDRTVDVQGSERAAVIIDPNAAGGGGGGVQYSSAVGGMRYLATHSGAIVQSHGRLGTILFQPGDVILSIGGMSLTYGGSVDGGVNRGYVTNNRTVVVRDRNSGRVLTLYY